MAFGGPRTWLMGVALGSRYGSSHLISWNYYQIYMYTMKYITLPELLHHRSAALFRRYGFRSAQRHITCMNIHRYTPHTPSYPSITSRGPEHTMRNLRNGRIVPSLAIDFRARRPVATEGMCPVSVSIVAVYIESAPSRLPSSS
jgi:hypothetical protein